MCSKKCSGNRDSRVFGFLNSRGQEAAPFEVLIAVILMGFVVLVGLNSMNMLSEQKQAGELRALLNELKYKVELAASGQSRESVSVFFPSGYSKRICDGDVKSSCSRLAILYSGDSSFCSNLCPGHHAQCKFIQFKSVPQNGIPYPPHSVCLMINPLTSFSESGCTSPDDDKFEAVNWDDSDNVKPIEEGRYLLVNESGLYDSTSKVCVYKVIN
jgi:hypothetical protein